MIGGVLALRLFHCLNLDSCSLVPFSLSPPPPPLSVYIQKIWAVAKKTKKVIFGIILGCILY